MCRGSHWSRNVKSANHFQTILQRYFLVFCMQQFHLCQILITRLSWKPDTVEGGGGKKKKSIDVNEQALRDFYHVEEIAGLIVLGLCVEPRGVCKLCE